MKLAFLNFADGVYTKGQVRLRESLHHHGISNTDMLFWSSYPEHWPKESEVFKGFKPFAFKDAEAAGFSAAIWIDATCVCVKEISAIEKILQDEGVYIFSRYSETVGNWISDYSLERLKIEREYVHHMPELTSCVVGINFKHPKGRFLLEQWYTLAHNQDTYNGGPPGLTFSDTRNNNDFILSKDPRVKGHRTDQSIVGLLSGAMSIFPENQYIFDIIGEASSGRRYAKYIPPKTIFIQNRDIRNNEYLKFKEMDKILTNKNLFYTLGKILYTTRRKIKDAIKWYLVYRKKFTYR